MSEHMSLPASQNSVLDSERIERVDDNTVRCYVYRFKFFPFEVCPVLLVRVESSLMVVVLSSCLARDAFPLRGFYFVTRISCTQRKL